MKFKGLAEKHGNREFVQVKSIVNVTGRDWGQGARLVLIDLLRFIAALSVLFFHYCFRGEQGGFVPPLQLPQWLSGAAAYGGMGVYLFFVISGFVIAYSAHGRSAWAFAASRFARLYPTYVLAVTATALVLMLAGQGVSLSQYAANLILFPKLLHQPMVDGVYWSIQYEVLFYAWVFALVLLGLFDRFAQVIVAVWLLIAVLNTWGLHSGAVALVFLTQYAGLFVSGIVLFLIRRDGMNWMNRVLLLAAIVISYLACEQEMRETLTLYGAAFSPIVFSVLMGGIFAVMGFATLYRGALPWAGAMVALGALTYPLYLLHQMIGYQIITLLAGSWVGGVAVIIATASMLALAALVHWVFERPVVPAVRKWLEGFFVRVGLEK